jgi:hypothetical protein
MAANGSQLNERAADFYAPEIRDMLRSASGTEGNQVSVRVSMADWSDNSSGHQSGSERVRRWVPY